MFVFDGAGKFTGKQSSSRGGKIGREKLQGTYTLDSDCTGTLTFDSLLTYGQTHWDLYVTEDHKKGYLIRMDEGSMAVRRLREISKDQDDRRPPLSISGDAALGRRFMAPLRHADGL